ncbi:MAG: 30S ribosomal protein S4 [Patescibacteria group bacterium]
MARYTGPKCRLCRREGVKLFLKGARCESEKCAMVRRKQIPGQHGASRKRPSGYAVQLREKQKAKRIYGILETQFKNYVTRALKKKEVTGEVLMQMLEARLDSVIYRAGYAASRAQARQFIRFGYYAVNGRPVTIPSYQVGVGSVVSILSKEKVAPREIVKFPQWLQIDSKKLTITLSLLPSEEALGETVQDVNPQLIVEYYSR